MGMLVHGTRMISMITSIMSLLGPDQETMTELLEDLGRRHVKYGVKAQYIPLMGQAIAQALEETLGKEHWTEEAESAWYTVYDEMSKDIMMAILEGPKE